VFPFNPRNFVVRAVGFLCFWVILAGIKPVDVMVGLIAACVAAAVSQKLLPPGDGRLQPILLARLAARFLRQSVVAGVDVAWRALHPRLPLHPGFIVYDVQSPAGRTRDAFCTMASMLPGTLPTDTDENDRLLVHCLDVTQPVADQLSLEESLFRQAVGGARPHG
jgi:multicomponent Na+:H+ antiporter subunit E